MWQKDNENNNQANKKARMWQTKQWDQTKDNTNTSKNKGWQTKAMGAKRKQYTNQRSKQVATQTPKEMGTTRKHAKLEKARRLPPKKQWEHIEQLKQNQNEINKKQWEQT